MARLLTFEYCSVHGALAAAYTAGTLAAEFGAANVRMRRPGEIALPLLAEGELAAAIGRRTGSRLLGVVDDGERPTWALVTAPDVLAADGPLLARALAAVLLARPHRPPMLEPHYRGWLADRPLRAARVLAA